MFLHATIARHKPRRAPMDDTTAFMEVSALLTGRDHFITDSADKVVFQPIADEYRRSLMAVFADKLPPLIEAYKTLASVVP